MNLKIKDKLRNLNKILKPIINSGREGIRSWYYWAIGYTPYYYRPMDRRTEYCPRDKVEEYLSKLPIRKERLK